MLGALLYLQVHSYWNRLVTRLKRLKKPKYLVGGIVGGLYFYFYFFRFFLLGGRGGKSAVTGAVAPEFPAVAESVGAIVLLLLVAWAWIVPHARAALAFTEAEVAFLFPAPVTRRTLIHFKLLKSQAAILFTTLFMMLVSGRFVRGGAFWIHAAGWWVILSTLNLHFLAASFERTRLLDRGVSHWRRRWVALLVLGALAGAVFAWGRQAIVAPTLQDLTGLRAFTEYLARVAAAGPAPYLLYPFRLVVRPYLAADAWHFLGVVGPALLLLGAHYWWVIHSDVAFEEASVALAQKRADLVAAARTGRSVSMGKPNKAKRAPFALPPKGLPAIALFWKNLISAGQMFTLRLWLILALATAPLCVVLGGTTKNSDLLPVFGVGALVILGWSLLIGPQIVRQDFRQDLPVADILKMYPLRGWEVVLGELLAPVAILTGVQCVLLIAAVCFLNRLPAEDPIPLLTRTAFAAAAAVIMPLLNLVSLLIPNAAVLLFPAWVQTGRDGPHGIEATGQRLIFALGQFLVFFVSLLPAGAAFAVVYFVLIRWTGLVIAVPLAALAAAVALAVEAGVGVKLLGKLFEQFDLSSEPAN
jgi:ABC-2 type transport system permease protein